MFLPANPTKGALFRMTGRGTFGDWRGRVGLLWPHDGHTDDEFRAYLPDGVTLPIARFKAVGELTSEAGLL